MLAIVLAMLVILLLAAAVVVYVAFPHRGEDVPRRPVGRRRDEQGRRRGCPTLADDRHDLAEDSRADERG